MKILVSQIAGRNAVASKDGDALYGKILEAIAHDTVELDFEGVEIYSTPFFNLGIARLLEHMPSDMLNEKVKFVNISPLGIKTLRRVIENAKRHYSANSKKTADGQ